jgi:hypothetical protein
MVHNEEIEDGTTKALVEKMVDARQTWRDLRASLARNNPEVFIPITPKMQRQSLTLRHNRSIVPCCGIPNFVVKAIDSDKRKTEIAKEQGAQSSRIKSTKRKTTKLGNGGSFVPSPPSGSNPQSTAISRKMSVAAGSKDGVNVLRLLSRMEDRQQEMARTKPGQSPSPMRRRMSALPSTGALHSPKTLGLEMPLSSLADNKAPLDPQNSQAVGSYSGNPPGADGQKRRLSNFFDCLKLNNDFRNVSQETLSPRSPYSPISTTSKKSPKKIAFDTGR